MRVLTEPEEDDHLEAARQIGDAMEQSYADALNGSGPNFVARNQSGQTRTCFSILQSCFLIAVCGQMNATG